MRSIFVLVILLLFPISASAYQAATTAEVAADTAQEAQAAPAEETAPVAGAVSSKQAREDDFEVETLVGLGDVDHGGYGGPVIRYSRMAGQEVIQFGGRGGWLIDHHFLIGGGGYGVTNQPRPPANIYSPTGRALEMNIGYGGLVLEYLIAPSRLFHGTVGVLVGGGGISVNEINADLSDDDDDRRDREERFQRDDSFFVVEPEIGIEMNVVKFLRINLTGGYRFVTGVGGIGFDNADFRGPSGALALKFGKF